MAVRKKRVWKACERCRLRKTKCDLEVPCSRCRNDCFPCISGPKMKAQYRQVEAKYAEVLEINQLTLICAIRKLYSMVRNSQPWDLGEPEMNDEGKPVVHDIALKLGCIRENVGVDLFIQSTFPEYKSGVAELSYQLERHQSAYSGQVGDAQDAESADSGPLSDQTWPSELDYYFDVEQKNQNVSIGDRDELLFSPQSLANDTNMSFCEDASAMLIPDSSVLVPSVGLTNWWIRGLVSNPSETQYALQQPIIPQNSAIFDQEMLENESFEPIESARFFSNNATL